MFISCFKKSEKLFTTWGLFISAMSHVKLIAETRLYLPQKHEIFGIFLQFFESFRGKIYKIYIPREMKNGLGLRQ